MTHDGQGDVRMSDEDAAEDVPMGPRWKPGDSVIAFWGGNGCYYPATVAEVNESNRTVTVTWGDADMTHRTISFDQVMEPSEETSAWSAAKIDRRASVRQTADKGRCLYTNEVCEPGQVVFVERPVLVALPALFPALWEHLKKMHEEQPLSLGTITFHFAALISEIKLEASAVHVILDKFVPDPNEGPGDDVLRILRSLQEHPTLAETIKLKERPMDPRRLQRLVSAWRYNSFGHHKEDGLVLYNRISMCAHSCDPSCCWSYGDDDAFILRARMSLDRGDELTVSYLQDEDLLKSTRVRRQKLQNWQFTCSCSRCRLRVDASRGFRCRRCRLGVLFVVEPGTLQPCQVCNTTLSPEETQTLLSLEEEYVERVEGLDKTDVEDVELVHQAAIEIFENHWILYVMNTMLWEAYKEKKLADAIEHQYRRIKFHEHHYCRPTFILAWSHEELGDCLQRQYGNRRWQQMQEYQRAFQMLAILCGTNHQYTTSPYSKFLQVSAAGTGAGGGGGAGAAG